MGKHVVHLAGQALPLGQRGGLGLRGPGLLQLGEQQFCPLVTLPQPPREQRQQEERQDPEIIQDDARDGGAPVGQPCHRDRGSGDHRYQRAETNRQYQGGQADGGEHPEERCAVALQADQRRRADHGHDQHSQLHCRPGLSQPHRGDDGTAEHDESHRDAKRLTVATRSRPGLERGDHHEPDHGHREHADRQVGRLFAAPRPFQLGHPGRSGGFGAHPSTVRRDSAAVSCPLGGFAASGAATRGWRPLHPRFRFWRQSGSTAAPKTAQPSGSRLAGKTTDLGERDGQHRPGTRP